MKKSPKHDCPVMSKDFGWTELPIGTVGVCSCGRSYRVMRPAFADRHRWQKILMPDLREQAIIEEGEALDV